MKNFTPEDLLEYHYGDMSPAEAAELQAELERNWALRQKLSVIREAALRLDKSMVSPRPEAVEAVLAYAERQVTTSVK